MKTKIDIVSGFLGSGKTTLIKKLLDEFRNKKIAIIENEFGEIGIDGKILSDTSVNLKEINSGCICCTLVDDFTKTIENIVKEYKPDRIIIEPSGVGKLSDVIKACESDILKNFIDINIKLTVVDVSKFKIYIKNFNEFYENQIKNASTIVLTRTDITDNSKIKNVVTMIREINPNAEIITTPLTILEPDKLIEVAELGDKDLEELKISYSCCCKDNSHKGCSCESHSKNHHHKADDVFQFWGEETIDTFSLNKLEECLSKLNNEEKFGSILRAKGILNTDMGWKKFDFVPDEVMLKDINVDYNGRLCIIGSNLNREELSKLFQYGKI
jgi:G3E family GTPase